ncbi:MAG TPA: tetratricopeptide repeat protein [Geobacteraceae bacterium]
MTYIVQRFTSLATLFYLGSLLLYARARLVQEGGGAGRRRVLAAGLYLLALLAALLAMKTKQIAFTLPFVVVLYEFTFFSGRIVKRVGAMALFLLTLAVVPLTLTGPARLSGEFLDRLTALPKESPLMPRLDYLCTQFRVIVTYIRLLLFPAGQRLEYDYPIYRTFFTPPVLLSFLCLLALVVLGGFLWLRSRGVVRRAPVTGCSQRLVAFGIFWFFITLAVESSIIPISDVIFEHRLYLPSVGAAIAITAALLALVDRAAARRPWVRAGAAAGFFLVAALLALATFQRNRVWATEVSLWEDTVAKSPNLPRPLNNLAAVYLKNGDPHKALAVLVRANDLAPGYTDTWLNICIALDRLGMYDGRFRYGSELFDASGNIKPQHLTEWFALASNNLGLAYEVLGNHARALVQFDRALKLAPNLAEAHLNRGLALLASGDRGGALEEYRVLTTLDPKTARKMALWFAAGGGR